MGSLAYAEKPIPDGVKKVFYDSGSLRFETNYRNGVKDGISREYYKNGSIKAAAIYLEGKKQGVYKEFYPTSFLQKITFYNEDVLHGDYKKYYEDGRLHFEWKFINGEMVQNYIRKYEYHQNGNLKLEYYFNEGDGFWNEFYEDGQLSLRVILKFGHEVRRMEYNKIGRLTSDKSFPEVSLKNE